jgi:hypothetical protein
MASHVHEGTTSEANAASIIEVWKAFTSLFTGTAEELREFMSTI